MIILGIDPALTKLGWGVILASANSIQYIDSGVIETKSDAQIHKRLASIASKLESIILQYQPSIVGMEETFVNNNAASSLKLGYARGAVMALIGKHELEFREFKPNMIKKTVVGTGHADKYQINHMIKLLLPSLVNKTLSADEADALAVSYTCFATFRNYSQK